MAGFGVGPGEPPGGHQALCPAAPAEGLPTGDHQSRQQGMHPMSLHPRTALPRGRDTAQPACSRAGERANLFAVVPSESAVQAHASGRSVGCVPRADRSGRGARERQWEKRGAGTAGGQERGKGKTGPPWEAVKQTDPREKAVEVMGG